MRRIRAITGPIALCALLAATPQLVLAQVEMECRACRSGTDIRFDQLGDFLAKGVAISYPGKVLTTLRLDMLDLARSGGVVGSSSRGPYRWRVAEPTLPRRGLSSQATW